jgi:hypothetical protein
MSNFLDALNRFQTDIPTIDEAREMVIESQPTPLPVNPDDYKWEWQKEYDALRSAANTTMSGYISPYEGTGWGGNPLIINNLERLFEAATEAKLEPSKLFTSETAQLRTIGSDQYKILRLFESKLKESLTEKGKFGLNEMDIEGLQALTAGKGVMISAVKEQVAIKAKQAELRIKQQAAEAGGGTGRGGVAGDSSSTSNAYGFGREFMDSIINNPIPDNVVYEVPATTNTSLEDASNLLDEITSASDVARFEASSVKPYVVVGNSDESAEFVAYDSAGNVVTDYPLPSSTIVKVDRDANIAEDNLSRKFPIKYKDE